MKRVFVLLMFLMLAGLVMAHTPGETAERTGVEGLLHLVMILAAWVGTLFFVWTAFSCHHFRFFSSRKLQKHPPACGKYCASTECPREMPAKQAHRFAFYGVSISFLVHFSLVFYLGELVNQQPLFIIDALLLLGAFSLWLLSCHFLKYKLGRIARSKHPKSFLGFLSWKSYKAVKVLNEYHGAFMWMAFIFMFFHLFLRFVVRV